MIDKEMLELAAKAAGIDLTGTYYTEIGGFIFRNPRTKNWNPLTDDGDALRLAVKLCCCIDVLGGVSDCRALGGETHSVVGGDTYKSTRRAIVLAAAEIGRTL